MLSNQSGTIVQSKAYVKIVSGPWEYAVKAIAGSYPQYQHVIPKDSECSITMSLKDNHYLRSALPLLETTTEHKAVHLYATKGDVRFLSENLDSMHVKIPAEYSGEDTAVIQMNREPLLAALHLGFNKFSFNPGGVNPIMATGRGDDVFVFMSLHGGLPADQVIKAVTQDNQPKQEEATMPKENRQRAEAMEPADAGSSAGLKVVNNEPIDPFEELFSEIDQLKQTGKDFISLASTLQQKAKTVQKNARRREREFKSTRDILNKLKIVSGF